MNIQIDADHKAMHISDRNAPLHTLHQIAQQYQHISLQWDVLYLNQKVASFRYKPCMLTGPVVIDAPTRTIDEPEVPTPAGDAEDATALRAEV